MPELFEDLARGILATLAYATLGVAILAVGFAVLDRITPGNLGQLLYTQRNANVALLAASHMVALAAVIVVAIVVAADDLARGLLEATLFGLLGIALLALAFWIVDRMTPGDLGVIVTSPEPHPAVWFTAASHLALGAVLAAAVS